ncbi:MAG TPA: PQQ-dependent sugar dehydrogenase [Acidobacteriota bacterium]|jgi:glucose/arabinose dehydrogenase
MFLHTTVRSFLYYITAGFPLLQRGAKVVRAGLLLITAGAMLLMVNPAVSAQDPAPTLTVPDLSLRTVISGLKTPISMAFLGPNDFFLLEKDTGKVLRIVNGAVQSTVLDLAVNFASERGLLGIALHPDFPVNPRVYLFWSCRTATAPPNAFFPQELACLDFDLILKNRDSDETLQSNLFGADTDNMLATPLLGNRIDSFLWNGSTLTLEKNLIFLRSFQNDGAPVPPNQDDENQLPRGNHDGGVLAFGPDRKLYAFFGDAGRRGQMQNLPSGPTATGLGPTVADDQFGGPAPDLTHFSGIILRLNDDGTAPADNPFFTHGQSVGGDVGFNLRRVWAYGVRNGFGMAFDPVSGNLWDEENGEDAFDEINRIERGMNSGWIQIIGPMERVSQYKAIETTSLHHEDFPNLQQFRWGPSRIADTPQEALARLFVLPGSVYRDPEFSWKHVLAPAGIGFVGSQALGSQYFGDLLVGFAVPEPLGGPLFRFKLSADRKKLSFSDSRLQDLVADNATFHDMGESESLLIGKDFGVITDIKTSPGGGVYIVSLTNGAIYELNGRAAGLKSFDRDARK